MCGWLQFYDVPTLVEVLLLVLRELHNISEFRRRIGRTENNLENPCLIPSVEIHATGPDNLSRPDEGSFKGAAGWGGVL